MTKPKADLLQGTLDMLILKALSLGPLHGYGIIQRLRQLSDELLDAIASEMRFRMLLLRARNRQRGIT